MKSSGCCCCGAVSVISHGFGSARRPSVSRTEMEPPRGCECCWAELLRSHRPRLRLFTCLRGWRYVTLQHKHRLHAPTTREWQQARFFEMELPLHAAVTALAHSGDTVDDPFELLGSFNALYPHSAELLDHQRRPPLYYALEQRWGLEKLSWLVDKSLGPVLEKDLDGRALTTHAIVNGCPEELVIRLAVAAASRCIRAVDELLDGQHSESARRFCQRALQDFFAGAPKFPHAQCRAVLGVRRQYGEGQAQVAAQSIRDTWALFTDTWGHFGAPLLQRDLPEVLNPVIDSYVEVALVVKGEPLTYQWFVQQDGQGEGASIEGATQSFIFISPSIQPHNEGIYYCEVVNRRGRAVSTRMTVRVVDDRLPPDPTTDFVVDKALLAPGAHAIRRLKASAGGRVHDSQTDAAIACQPEFFVCLDRDGSDVSDTHGAEVAISRWGDAKAKLRLREGETLVSCVFDVLPRSMGSLLRPALLWLPHYLVADTNTSAVIVEIDPTSGRVLGDVEQALVEEEFARATIDRLGTFGVISRQKRLRNEESSSDFVMERACLLVQRPTTVSSSKPSGKVKLLLALVRDVANCRGEAQARLEEMSDESTIDTFQLNIREHFSLSLQLGGADRVVFRWPPPSSEVVVTEMAISLENLTSPSPEVDGDHPAFLRLPLRATVSKTPIQTRTRVNSVESRSHDTDSYNELTLFERDWTVLIPFLHDASKVIELAPPTPSIVERTDTRLVLDLAGITCSQDKLKESNHANEDTDEARPTDERTLPFSPYFYVVEMAVFSPTFWRRYDQTWWFDKTKTKVIDGMYKVVHRGFGTKVRISTAAYAGCVRVAWCSIDCFGTYSEPLLLASLPGCDTGGGPSSFTDANANVVLAPLDNWSNEMKETCGKLQQLMEDLCIDNGILNTVYGLPRSVRSATDVVVALLEAKTSLRSCNFELALLLSGFKALERQIKRIKLATGTYMKLIGKFLRLQRAIPELESRPEVTLPITQRLHELLREVFSVVARLSCPGWLQYFLVDEWFDGELRSIFSSTAELLASNASVLLCANVLQSGLEVPAGHSIPWIMKTARSYLLLAVGHLQEATDRVTKLLICLELCHALQLCPDDPSQQQNDDEDDPMTTAAEGLLAEFESPASQQALATLRRQDSFAKHLVCATPRDGEKCSRVPEAVHFDLDPFIRGVNRTGMHLVIRVANVSLDSCAVQGKATFCERTARLSFFPAAEFERKSRYRVTVREHEILSSLGGTLPERPPFTIHFSTPA